MRDAEEESPGRIREVLDSLLADGQEPTKAAVYREITGDRLSSFSGDNEWYTPGRYVEAARAVLGSIDLDPASSAIAQKTVEAAIFFTEKQDGLKQKWSGKVWCNPPYANPQIQHFTDKLLSEYAAGNVTAAVMLTNNSGDTRHPGWRVINLDRLTVRTIAPRIDTGLIAELDKWRLGCTRPRLIIIDVFLKVRPPRKKGEDPYSADYDAVTPLQRYASEHRLAVVLVTHTRKMLADDPLALHCK